MPPEVSSPPPPTLANAGARSCKALDAVLLGPHGEGRAILGFDGRSGLAAWKPEQGLLALQPITPSGQKVGAATTVTLAAGIEPKLIYALGSRFVVLSRRWDWQANDLNWWALAVDRDGHAARPPAEIGLADLDIQVGRSLDERRVALLVGPGYISKKPGQPARWQTLSVEPTGAIASIATAVDLRGLDGAWEEAELAGAQGWVALKEGVRQPDGVFEGRRLPAAAAVIARSPDTLAYHVTNAAVPPGRGPGGRIIEAMGVPVLERTRGSQRVGDPFSLTWKGNPIAHSMNIDPYIVWSGTHFIYPFWHDDGGPTHDRYVELLLPIDCRP